MGDWIPSLLYIDAIVIAAELPDCLQRHFDILHNLAQDSRLLVNLAKP